MLNFRKSWSVTFFWLPFVADFENNGGYDEKSLAALTKFISGKYEKNPESLPQEIEIIEER